METPWRRWDGNPASLQPAPDGALAAELTGLAGLAELTGLAGGGSVLADRAQMLLESSGGGTGSGGGSVGGGGPDDASLRFAGHLIEMAWLVDPGDPGIRRIRRQIFEARAEAAGSTMAHGVFSWAAQESGDHHHG